MSKEMYIEEIKDAWFECATEDNPELLYNFYRRYKNILYEFWNEGENKYMIDLYNTLCRESEKVYFYGARKLMRNPEIFKIWQKWNYVFNDKRNLMKIDPDLKAQCTITLYDELKKYEDDINFVGHSARFNQENRCYNTDEMKQVLELYSVCEEYHKRYEYIRDLFEDKQTASDNIKQLPTLPKELDTSEAKIWLQKAIDGGLLKDDYTTTDKVKSKSQMALLAEMLSEKIGLKNKYVLFEKLWGVTGLAKKRYKSREETGKVCGGEFIEAVFAD